MTIQTLEDLFHETLKDIYFAEKKMVKTLPKMAKAAAAPMLKKAITAHLAETEGQVARLEKVFAAMDWKPVAKKCEAIEGLVKEADEVMGEIEDAPTLDSAIISSAQTVEHYEIARYTTLVCWAQKLGFDDVEAMLQETLDQEIKADETLEGLAENVEVRKAA